MDYIKHPEMNSTSSGLPVYEFIVESEADIATLPTVTEKNGFDECVAAGSIATVKDLSVLYMLSSDGWTKC